MKLSRRGILAGLLATSAAPAAAVQHNQPKPTFIKGMIMPRSHVVAGLSRYGGYGADYPVVVYEYEIYDGEKFVPLNSTAGQQVIADLS